MSLLAWVLVIAAGFILVEKLWPANALPRVRGWYWRVALVNLIQLGLVILAGRTWDQWLARASLFKLPFGPAGNGLAAYVVSTFVYYWWHRFRHESRFFWNLCHQLHHSPRRIEVLTSFYKHPVEIFLNSMLSASIVYTLLGCSVEAGAWYTLFTAVAEYFYHWNISTPRWIGTLIQRPESHRIHHRFRHHTQNFADLPIWDMAFGTFANAMDSPRRCGYETWREDKFEDMLAFRNVNGQADKQPPLHLLPTCIGCSKRWACQESRARYGDR